MTTRKKITVFYFLLFLTASLSIALLQPLADSPPVFQNAPDEHARYLVPLYICRHGVLPTGYEEELLSNGVRWSYGFYTLLPYMVQGYTMRFVNLFTDSPLALLYTARLVNVGCGMLMAWLVLLIARKVFREERMQWVFSFLITFLPQALFMHTYVNPDSMCMMSIALMLYALLRGYGDGFRMKTCLLLAAGIILCALSYYNAYGYILSCILLFAAFFMKKRSEDGKWQLMWRPLLKKGIFISIIVLLCIGWSFIRNYMLYDGDFIGLSAKEAYIAAGGVERVTYQNTGQSIFKMLFGTVFLPKLFASFIAAYGSMTIKSWIVVYVFYLLFFAFGILGVIFVKGTPKTIPEEEAAVGRALAAGQLWQTRFFHANMVFCMLIPLALTIHYSYTIDYQAQGRYVLPALIPFSYYVCRGIQKIIWRISDRKGWNDKIKNQLAAGLCIVIVLGLLITVYACALPEYLKG